MKLITISRQFGSGGRELGKRLSDLIGWDYYDKQILARIAEENNMDSAYVQSILSRHAWRDYTLTYRSSFQSPIPDQSVRIELMRSQREILEQIAAVGNNCIIIGRDADIILQDYQPLRIFVCADMEQRLSRCMNFERKKESGQLSEKEVLRNIKQIDKARSQTREILTGKSWGDCTSFDLVINTGGHDIKHLAQSLANYVSGWFDE